jgi:glycosyltransferase involved in cell wall biosynthesis
MKILIVHEIDWIKKVPFEPHHIAELLSVMGHDIFVVDCAEPTFSKFVPRLHTSVINNYHRLYDDASITLIRSPSMSIKGINRLTHFLSCKKVIKKILVKNNIDLIFLYGVITNGIQCIELSKELNIPLIFRSLDITHKLVSFPLLENIIKKFEKNVFSNSKLILTTTPQLAKYAEEMGSSSASTQYFPLGINSNYFKPIKKNIKLAYELGIQKTDKIILFMGTLYPFAGIDYILKNFFLLQNKFPQIKFLIIGGGPHFKHLKTLTNKLQLNNSVIFTGFIEQNKIPDYISLADICINPFIISPVTNRIIPTKILEYLSCGKPVLSTPLKGTVEILPNETFGIIYSKLDVFVDSLITLLENPIKLQKLGNDGFNYIEKNHYWGPLVTKLVSIFDKNIILK